MKVAGGKVWLSATQKTLPHRKQQANNQLITCFVWLLSVFPFPVIKNSFLWIRKSEKKLFAFAGEALGEDVAFHRRIMFALVRDCKKSLKIFSFKIFFEARQVLRRKCENDFLLTKIIGYDFKLCLKIISYVTENIEDWQGLQWIAWKWFSHSLISLLNYLSRLAIKSSFNFNLI